MIHGQRHPGCRAQCDAIPSCRGYWFKVDMPGRRLRCQLKSAMCSNPSGAGLRQRGRMWQRSGKKRLLKVTKRPSPTWVIFAVRCGESFVFAMPFCPQTKDLSHAAVKIAQVGAQGHVSCKLKICKVTRGYLI
jgi:hypothetical protein